MKRDYVDFSAVPEHQQDMHARLTNWGRWCHGSGHAQMSPMFRMYRSSDVYQHYGATTVEPVDVADAARIAKGVIALPENHRHAMSWYYVSPTSPVRACRSIGCTQEGLALFVRDGRTMLINRRV